MASSVESRSETKHSLADDEDGRVNLIQRAQWLRAAILGANDGLLSTTSLMLGVGAAKDDHTVMIVSGLAGALAGACSMAVGEFVSVSTQRDIEQMTNDKCYAMTVKNDLENVEPRESVVSSGNLLKQSSPHGFTPQAVDTWANPLQNSSRTTKDKCHVMTVKNDCESMNSRDAVVSSPRSPFMKVVSIDTRASPLQESSCRSTDDKCYAVTVKNDSESVKSRESIISPRSSFANDVARDTLPNPYKAAGASGLSFLCGSVVPLLSAMVISEKKLRVVGIVVVASIALAVFGAVGARLGGSPIRVSAVRVVVGGWISMAVTYGLLMPLDRDHNGHQPEAQQLQYSHI